MERVRIALLTTELGVGGAERCLTQLATGLDATIFQPTVYSLAPPPPAERRGLVELLERASIPVSFIGVTSTWQMNRAIGSMTKLLQAQQPTILQTFLFHANIVGTFAARRAKVPVIVHGVRVADPRRWRHWMDRFASRQAARIVCVSHSVAEFTRHRSRTALQKLVVIPNGVDLRRVDAAAPIPLDQLGAIASRRAITCVARLDRQKGIDWLLQAARQFLQALPDHDLILVGDGPDAEELRILAENLRISDRVYFVGWRADVAGILKSSDVFVLPSRWEGMPNALLEAMACGLPVVATRVEGVAEVLTRNAEEQLVTFEDTAALVRQVTSIASNRQLAARLGSENRERIVSELTVAQMVASYERLYQQLLTERQSC